MIYTIPMLLTKSIDKHIIPGICKAYERFAIVFRMNEITSAAVANFVNSNKDSNMRLVDSHNTAKKRNENYLSELNAAPPGANPGNKPLLPAPEPEKQPAPEPPGGLSIDTRSMGEYMSIEPTWITINVTLPNNGGSFPMLIGVKVLPILIKDEDYAFEKLVSDRYAGFWSSLAKQLYRSTMRQALNYVYAIWKIPVVGPHRNDTSPASGSVKDDLFFNKSGYHMDNRIIACMDFNQVPEDFFDNPGKINRLYKLYWNALMMYDNVNRNLYFAAPEYRGQVSILPYSYLNTLSVAHQKTYDKEEQGKLKSSPLFHMKSIPASKLYESVNKYNTGRLLTEEKVLLKEEFDENSLINMDKNTMKNFIKKNGIKKIAFSLKNFNKSLKLKNPNMMVKSLDIFPEVSMKSVEIYALKNMGTGFVANYKYAQQVLKASTNIPEQFIKPVASALVIIAGNSLKILREALKKFVQVYRKREAAKKSNPDSNGLPFDEALAYLLISTLVVVSTSIALLYGAGALQMVTMFLGLNDFIHGIYNNPHFENDPYSFMKDWPSKLSEIDFTPFKDLQMPGRSEPVIQPEERQSIIDKLSNFFTKGPEVQDHNWFFSLLTKLGFDEKTLNEFNSTAYFTMGMLVCFIFIIIIQNAVRGVVRFSEPVRRG